MNGLVRVAAAVPQLHLGNVEKNVQEHLKMLAQAKDIYVNVYIGVLRYAAPLLAFFLLWRCLKPLMFFKREPEIWAWLCMEDGTKHALTHWEM